MSIHLDLVQAQDLTMTYGASVLPLTAGFLDTLGKDAKLQLYRTLIGKPGQRYRPCPSEVKRRKGSYRNEVDFVLCRVFTNFEKACRRFYVGRGPKLKDAYSIDDIQSIDIALRGVVRLLAGVPAN